MDLQGQVVAKATAFPLADLSAKYERVTDRPCSRRRFSGGNGEPFAYFPSSLLEMKVSE